MSPNADQSIDIPERYEDVTADWLTQALRAGGVLDGQSVSSFDVEPISAAASRNSSLARITVQYDRRGDGLPDSMFAKFVSRIDGNRRLADQFDLFRTEIKLYANLASVIPLNMPRLFFGGDKEGTDVAVLLLEEIRGVSKAGLSLNEMYLTSSETTLALSELSKMHGKWWNDAEINSFTWLGTIDGDWLKFLFGSYDEAWAGMREAVRPALSPEEIRICDKLTRYLPILKSNLSSMPATLCHGDFHLGNLLWDKVGEPSTVWAVDWQRPATGPAVMDVAWFLGTGTSKADLERVRRDHLPTYHSALLENGANDYDYERFLGHYRYGLLYGLMRGVVPLAKLDLARNDSVEFGQVLMGRLAAAAVDAGCGELLS